MSMNIIFNSAKEAVEFLAEEAKATGNDIEITMIQNFLKKRGWYTDEQEEELRKESRQHVLSALSSAEKAPKLGVAEMFEDVYDVLPPHLLEQKAEVEAHIARHPEAYKAVH